MLCIGVHILGKKTFLSVVCDRHYRPMLAVLYKEILHHFFVQFLTKGEDCLYLYGVSSCMDLNHQCNVPHILANILTYIK